MISKFKMTCTVASVLCLSVLLWAGAAQAAKMIRIQSVYPEVAKGGVMVKDFAKRVNEYTKGAVKVKIYWPNQLVKAKEAYTAVSKGMVDALYSVSLYYGGIVPAMKAEWLAMGWDSPSDAYQLFYKHGLLDYLREANAKKGVYLLGVNFAASMGFLTNFEVTGLESFRGKKIRAMSADAPLVRDLGASPVAMPTTDMYAAMKRGTIDGVLYPYFALSTYKFTEVATTLIKPGIHTPAITDITINMGVWKSLSPEMQKAVAKACEDTCLQSIKWSDKWDEDAFALARKHNIKIVELSKADRQKLLELNQKNWKQIAEQSPQLAGAVALMEKYLESKKSK
ncbi:MAG: TRAP transporter substrate-binding protein DctP [Deltaproteobacteria bacterium]|nr:TRAP transporter substrate-binding protein DctP [Deltaproteobacteria bacterium]